MDGITALDILDKPLRVTFFASAAASKKTEETITLRHLAEQVRSVARNDKASLPWLKLAAFGDEKTDKGSLRHDANVLSLSGIEADYDGEEVSVDEVTETLASQGIAALVYTSPSHRPDKPRWRVLCPLSTEIPPDRRTAMLGRLNGLLRGVLSPESFTLSQSYFYGYVVGNESHRVELIDGTAIDRHDDLDLIWQGRPGTKSGTASPMRSGPIDEAGLLDQIADGSAYHSAMIRLAGHWATQGASLLDVQKRLRRAMETVPEGNRDRRWRSRYADIDRTLEYVFGKRLEEVSATAGEWPEPIPLPAGLPPVAPFDENLLPVELRPWVMDIANRMQCPPDFPAVAAIVCAGAVIGRQIGIRPKRRDDWLVVPNLWGAIVGRPSLMKSPALAESRNMLARLDAEARKRYEAEVAEYETAGSIEKLVTRERTKAAEKKIKDAMTKGADPAAAARAFMEANTDRTGGTDKPVRRRYTTQDPTVEKLGELLNETPRGMLVFRDELIGFLRSMDKDGHENDRAFYLEAWNGNAPYTYDRIGRGTLDIHAACVSVLGGIQPGPLSAYIAQANRGGAGDDGLLQRLQMLVWPDAGDSWVNVDDWPDTEAKNRVYAIFQRLDQIAPCGEDVEIEALRFDHTAQETFNTWRDDFERRLRTEEMAPSLEAHLTKYRSLLPSLALIFHLIDTPDETAIGVSHVVRAARWLRYLETHARRLYAQILDPGVVAAAALVKRLPSLPDPFTARDVYRNGWAGLDRMQTDRAIEVLVDFHHIAPKTENTGGRPSVTYQKTPASNFCHSLKGGTDKTDKTPSVSFGSTPCEGDAEFSDDEVTL